MRNVLLFVLGSALFAGCSDKAGDEPKAEASVSVDLEETKESAKKTFQNAERELEKGAAKAKDKLEDAGEAISEKFAEAKDKLTDDDKASVKVEIKKD